MFTKNRKKLIKSLHQKKYRDLHQLFIVEGEKMVMELLNADSEQSEFSSDEIYISKKYTETVPNGVVISEIDMQFISGFKNAPGILAVATYSVATYSKVEEINFDTFSDDIIILDDIKDPGNLGTIIRTAEWFGIKDIIVSSETVDLYNPKTVQSTMGSIFRVSVWKMELSVAIATLKKNNFKVYAADMNGTDIKSMDWANKKAIIIGNEANGISSEVISEADQIVSIKGKGKAESLNAGIAASIIVSTW